MWVVPVPMKRFIDVFQPGLQCEASEDSPYSCGYTVRALSWLEAPTTYLLAQ